MTRRSPRPALLAAALGLALAACGPDPAPGADAASAPDASSGLVMTADGVGALGAETPFDTAAVRAALPAGFAVEVQPAETGGRAGPVVWALRDGLLVLEVYGDDGRVGRIDAASDQVEGPGGARTGQTFAEVDGGRMRCEPGEDELSDRVVCRARRAAVGYVFAHAAAAGTMPDDDQLADAILERMVWHAD